MQALPAPARTAAEGFFTTIRRAPAAAAGGPLQPRIPGRAGTRRGSASRRRPLTSSRRCALPRGARRRLSSNDYYDSDVAWMKLDASIEPTSAPTRPTRTAGPRQGGVRGLRHPARRGGDHEAGQVGGRAAGDRKHLPIDAKLRNPKLGARRPSASSTSSTAPATPTSPCKPRPHNVSPLLPVLGSVGLCCKTPARVWRSNDLDEGGIGGVDDSRHERSNAFRQVRQQRPFVMGQLPLRYVSRIYPDNCGVLLNEGRVKTSSTISAVARDAAGSSCGAALQATQQPAAAIRGADGNGPSSGPRPSLGPQFLCPLRTSALGRHFVRFRRRPGFDYG